MNENDSHLGSTVADTDEQVSDPVVSSQYRSAADECAPRHLDGAILKRASTAAEPARRIPRWFGPLALAATLVLGVGIVFQVGKQGLENIPPKAVQAGSDAYPGGLAVDGAAPSPGQSHCAAGSSQAAQTWWECISRLEQLLDPAEIEYERALLYRAYPDFSPPDKSAK